MCKVLGSDACAHAFGGRELSPSKSLTSTPQTAPTRKIQKALSTNLASFCDLKPDPEPETLNPSTPKL